MRILVTIPHFASRGGFPGNRKHSSQSGDIALRAMALEACLQAWLQVFGTGQSIIQIADRRTRPANKPYRAELHLVVCTVGSQHTLDLVKVDRGLYQHLPLDVDPMMLGYECHGILRDRWGNYDYYCYLEDDLIIHDSWFFTKLAWFNHHVGQDKLLQPNRFELGSGSKDQRVYIDGDLAPHVTEPFQNIQEEPVLKSTIMNVPIEFCRTLNPHAGCFFLNSIQMQRWINQPYFLDRATSFVGPLESAASLGIMRAFKIYKPSLDHANFLEIQHHGTRFLDLIRYK